MSIRSGINGGLVSALINVFCVFVGITILTGSMFDSWFSLGSSQPGAWALVVLVAFFGGTRAVTQLKDFTWKNGAIAGLVAGVTHGLVMGVLIWLLSSLISSGIDLRKWLVQLSSDAVNLLALGRAPVLAGLVVFAGLGAASLAGALLRGLSFSTHWDRSLKNAFRQARHSVSQSASVHGISRHRFTRPALIILGVGVLLAAPFFLGQYWNYTLGTVGIYVILGLGLNIIVGISGLLVLGYAAFFAVGAYTVAILTAPQPHNIMMDFWLVIPIGIALACLAAVLLGLPVLRMRGDYLAIVTLGFGEIIRILVRSDLLTGFTGGPRGIRNIGYPTLFGINLGNEFYFMYIILMGILLTVFISQRLENSRVGRAWRAMREDETVAQAMGVNTYKYKLLAFVTGAAFAGLGGVIFASRNAFTGPEDYTLLVSINVLCLLIVGGIGSIPGVVVGAFALKGLPEILRQLADYRMLAFGALLMIMMIARPEGLWPSSRRLMEKSDDAVPAVGQAGDACDVAPQGETR